MKLYSKSIDQIIYVPLRRFVSNFTRYIAHVVFSWFYACNDNRIFWLCCVIIYIDKFSKNMKRKKKDILCFCNSNIRLFLVILRGKYKNKRSYTYKYLSSLHFKLFAHRYPDSSRRVSSFKSTPRASFLCRVRSTLRSKQAALVRIRCVIHRYTHIIK